MTPIRVFALATLLVVLPLSQTRAQWPQFRGPTTQGVAASSSLPIAWSSTENVRWRSTLPGRGWSSPVVSEGTVYVTAAIPDEAAEDSWSLELLLIDAASGTLLRQVPLFAQGEDAPSIHQKNSHASPTPLVDGDAVYVHFGHQGTARVDREGNVIWKNDSLGYPPVHGNGGSPVVVGDRLIFSRDGADISEITALDTATGQIAWQTPRQVEADRSFSFATPLVLEIEGQTQVILPGSNVVQSVSPESGQERWRVRYDGYSVIPRPVFADGLVFVCTGYNRPSLLAIDPTGTGDVTETHVRWTADSGIPHTPSLAPFGQGIAMVSDKGIASFLSTSNGAEIWKKRIGGNFSASPILSGSTLYLLSEEGVCTVLDIAGEPVVLQENKLGERTLASPAVLGNDLLIRTEQALYRIGGNDQLSGS